MTWLPPAARSKARSPRSAEVCVHRVAVLGAAGYAGALAAAIVEGHPGLELTVVTARSDAGRRLDHLYPRHRVRRELEAYRADEVAERGQSALVAYPRGGG